MPASLHLSTAKSTFILGGSFNEQRPMRVNPDIGNQYLKASSLSCTFLKFFQLATSNKYAGVFVKILGSNMIYAKAKTLSPVPPYNLLADSTSSFLYAVNSSSTPLIMILSHLDKIRSGAPFIIILKPFLDGSFSLFLLAKCLIAKLNLISELKGIKQFIFLAESAGSSY
jgi:hypothetical protein